MSKLGGLIKQTDYWNRVQQKREWKMILSEISGNEPDPDFTLSVKKIDKYMESVCVKYGLVFSNYCGA